MRISIQPGVNEMPRVVLQANDGARAEVYLHGAHVASWAPAGGPERLFLSPRSEFRPSAAIRGGVPICFPQFSGFGPLPKHGFARSQAWELTSVRRGARTSATFSLRDTEESRKLWPHQFLARYTVSTGGDTLRLRLEVQNTGEAPFSFTGALHTYFAVEDVEAARIEGLAGLPYLDATGEWTERVQGTEPVVFRGEVDSVYYDVKSPLTLVDGERRVRIGKKGFPDVVVWNPGAEKGAGLADLPEGGYQGFVCVEAVAIGKPVELMPGISWRGEQELRADPGERSSR